MAPTNLHTSHTQETFNWVWDEGTSEWVKMTQPGASAGGGATTIADGADVAQGTTSDAAWVSGNGTVISLLKKLASAGAGSAVSIADGSDVAEGTTTDAAVVTDVAGTVAGKLRGLVKIFASVWDSANGRLKVDGSAVTQPVSLASAPTTAVTNAGLTNIDVLLSTRTKPADQQHTIVDSGTVTAVTAITNALPAGTNVIGHVIADTGSTTAVTGNVAVTNAGLTNLDVLLSTRTKPADQQHAIIDSGTTTVTQATGTNLHVVVDTAPTTAVTGPLTDTQLRASAFTVTANAGTNLNTSALALDATLTGRTQKTQLTDGTRDGTVKAASTLPAATDTAVVTSLRDAIPAGANVIGHVINDTGSTTAVTGNVTVVQPTGTSLHAVLDTTSTTAVTQATGTNLHTVIDSGTLTTVSTVTAVTAITNALPTGTNTLGSVKVTDGTTTVKVTVANAQPASTDGALLANVIDTFAGTALASASRGVATVNTDIVNYNGKGIRVWQDLTVLGVSSVCTFTIQEKDPVSGKFLTILASAATGAGINATGTAKLTVYPGLTAAANSIASDILPMNIRIVSTVATAASTFSIGYSIIP